MTTNAELYVSMNNMRKFTKIAIFAYMAFLVYTAHAALPPPGTVFAPNDPRYCGEPIRDKNGKIQRNRTELNRFVTVFPCPGTLHQSITCEGWQIDHVIPLGSGGCDKVINMQWLPTAIKTCKGTTCKDRWERRYHSIPRNKVQP